MFYVYMLVRPDGRPFYVGKGKGQRIAFHEWEARRGCKCRKCRTIRKIWRSGGVVERRVVFTTDGEQEAFDRERELIAEIGRENLTNATDGGEGASGSRGAWDRPGFRDQMSRLMSQAMRIHWGDPEKRKAWLRHLDEIQQDSNRRSQHSAYLRQQWNTAEYRLKMTSIVRENWADPEWREMILDRQSRADRTTHRRAMGRIWSNADYRKKMLAILKEASQRPEAVQKRAEAIRQAWQQPDSKLREALDRLHADPEVRRKQAEATAQRNREYWADPEYKAKVVESIRQSSNTPEGRQRRSEAQRATWTDERRAAQTERNHQRWSDPEARERARERKKAQWADPEWRARRMAAIAAKKAGRQSDQD